MGQRHAGSWSGAEGIAAVDGHGPVGECLANNRRAHPWRQVWGHVWNSCCSRGTGNRSRPLAWNVASLQLCAALACCRRIVSPS